MKCIRCGTDSKFKDRSNHACPKCHGRFAFEPKKGDPFTDAAFQRAIDAVSAKGQLRWGAEHLYYELARRRRVNMGFPGFGVFICVFLTVLAAVNGSKLALIPALVAIAIAVSVWRAKRQKFAQLDQQKFNGMLAAWQHAHGTPKGMIVRATPRGAPKPRRALEADIADYSFDRAVICDRARTADLLLANNFHFENNCAVLSVDGYPEAQFETVRAMLRRNPRLRVFALHDATPEGCRLAHTLATDSAWFAGPAGIAITDVGLRPTQALTFRGLFRAGSGAKVSAGAGIARHEAAWLSANALELAAIRPEQVLKRLYKALTRKTDGDDSGGGSDGGSSSGSGNSSGSGSGAAAAAFAGAGGDSGGAGASTSFDSDSFSYEASDIDSDSDGFG